MIDLEPIKKALAEATPGPWRSNLWGIISQSGHDVIALEYGYYDECSLVFEEADKYLILLLRDCVPDLIAEIEELRGIKKQVQE